MEFNWITIKKPLLEWYKKNHRDLKWRNTKEPYHIWISEIMLQQTRVEAVKGYYERFLREVPNIKALSVIEEEKLLKLWEGLGYYNRARNLKKAAVQIMELYDGSFPTKYKEVVGLPGIGEYTAGAICSICFGLPTPAVDGNVLRVMVRLSDCYANIDDLKTKRMARQNLLNLYYEGNCDMLTQAFMELGAMVCIPNGVPKCQECPLKETCLAYSRDTWNKLPVRKEKKKRKIEEKTVFILHDGNQYGIRKRGSKGLLADMWEFYHVDTRLDARQAVDYISEHGFEPVLLEKEIPYTHIFTHVEWRMTAYYIECRKKKEELLWVDKDAFETMYALPSAYKVFLEKES
ncbi:MAG: A/G-specific adenine glycosylase [Lachnospiraceae bacterium]|nr:A/G-specific adenine glycosylase [Lachnospiraceae bacterium]